MVMFATPNIIMEIRPKELRWPAHILHMGIRNPNRNFVRNPLKNKLILRPRYRWEAQ
jgi:hypothetical protein